jgi:MFS family permease
MFRSLSGYNYRVWAGGALVSNVGTWMQRTAQDWIVLTQLTHHDAAAVGIVMALQFGPQLLLLPISGLVADRINQRHLLMATQAAMGVLGLALGILTVTHTVQLWHVYVFAFLLGCAAAFDAPARQTFVSQLVGGKKLSNAVALNSASFSLARMVGPAVAGLLTAAVGAGWVFLINAISFAAVLISLKLLHVSELQAEPRAARKRGNLVEGFRYVWSRSDIMVVLVIVFLIGTFGMNFPIFISTMSTVVFHQGAAAFGLLSSVMAVGSVVGALLSARRDKPRLRYLFVASAVFAVGCAFAAFAPGYWFFGIALAVTGLAAQTLMTTANGSVQLSTPPALRGRVMAIYMAIFMGATPIGAPIIGWVSNEYGPRWGLGVGAMAGVAATLVALVWLFHYRRLRLHFADRHLTMTFGMTGRLAAAEEIVTAEVTSQKV